MAGFRTLASIAVLLAGCEHAKEGVGQKVYPLVRDILLRLLADEGGRLHLAAYPQVVMSMVNTLSTNVFLPEEDDLEVQDAYPAQACIDFGGRPGIYNPNFSCPPTALALHILFNTHAIGELDSYVQCLPPLDTSAQRRGVFHIRNLAAMTQTCVGRAAAINALVASNFLGVDWLVTTLVATAKRTGVDGNSSLEGTADAAGAAALGDARLPPAQAALCGWAASLLVIALQDDSSATLVLRHASSFKVLAEWVVPATDDSRHDNDAAAGGLVQPDPLPRVLSELRGWVLQGDAECMVDPESLLATVKSILNQPAVDKLAGFSTLVTTLRLLARLTDDASPTTSRELCMQGAVSIVTSSLDKLTSRLPLVDTEEAVSLSLLVLAFKPLLQIVQDLHNMHLVFPESTYAVDIVSCLLRLLRTCWACLPSSDEQGVLQPVAGDLQHLLADIQWRSTVIVVALVQPLPVESSVQEKPLAHGWHGARYQLINTILELTMTTPELLAPGLALLECIQDRRGSVTDSIICDTTAGLSIVLGDAVGTFCDLVFLVACTTSLPHLKLLRKLIAKLRPEEALLLELVRLSTAKVTQEHGAEWATATPTTFRLLWLLLEVTVAFPPASADQIGEPGAAADIGAALFHILTHTTESHIAVPTLNALAYLFVVHAIRLPKGLPEMLMSAEARCEGDRNVARSAIRALRKAIWVDLEHGGSSALTDASLPAMRMTLIKELATWSKEPGPAEFEILVELTALLATPMIGEGSLATRDKLSVFILEAAVEAGVTDQGADAAKVNRVLRQCLDRWKEQGLVSGPQTATALSWLLDVSRDPCAVVDAADANQSATELVSSDLREILLLSMDQLDDRDLAVPREALDLQAVATQYCPSMPVASAATTRQETISTTDAAAAADTIRVQRRQVASSYSTPGFAPLTQQHGGVRHSSGIFRNSKTRSDCSGGGGDSAGSRPKSMHVDQFQSLELQLLDSTSIGTGSSCNLGQKLGISNVQAITLDTTTRRPTSRASFHSGDGGGVTDHPGAGPVPDRLR